MPMKEPKKTTVRLLSWTANPIGTIYAEWVQSRTQDPVPEPADVEQNLDIDASPEYYNKVMDVFEQVIDMRMPLGETIDFVFLLENVPVALREQLVRHRIGHKFGDRLGADIVPELAGSSSFWSQTTRIIDMGKFATEGDYLEPVWLEDHADDPVPGYGEGTPEPCPQCGSKNFNFAATVGKPARWTCVNGHEVPQPKRKGLRDFYRDQMAWIQTAYQRLVKAGMPLEDARNILPVAMQHRMTWKCNLTSLMHVLPRRGCWLAQLGMWEPVIKGIVDELATKINPYFRRLIDPPCFNKAGEFDKCAFGRENEEIVGDADGRFKGEYPPCSLWINNDFYRDKFTVTDRPVVEKLAVQDVRMPRYNRMMDKYAALWGRDPRTGERKQLT